MHFLSLKKVLRGLVDPRTDLLHHQSCDEFKDQSSFFATEPPASKLMADACMMASKLAYENPNAIRKVVTENWKMHVDDVFECMNKNQPTNPSQVVILMDRAEDAQAIIVAFCNAYDWSSNFDFSWYELPGIGCVHVGCLEALSLVDRRDMVTFTRLKKKIGKKHDDIKQKMVEHELANNVQGDEHVGTREISNLYEFYGSKSDLEVNGRNIFEEARMVERAINTEEEEEDVFSGRDNIDMIMSIPEDIPDETDEDASDKNKAGGRSVKGANADKKETSGTTKPRPSFLSGLKEAHSEENKRLLAYDAACGRLKELIAVHKNAKVFITGHSLGGALATVFTSILFHSREDQITSRLAAVYTFGQPKVGDKEFVANMTVFLNLPENRYFRVVYSNDLIPCLPYDDPVFKFKHLEPCFFYSSTYEGETVRKSLTRIHFRPVINAIRLGPEVLDAEVLPSFDTRLEGE